MPGSKPSMAVKKKQSAIPPSQGPLSTRTIQSQRGGNRAESKAENGSGGKADLQVKKAACIGLKICNTQRAATVSNGPNVDERLKAARQRREEHQKLQASRESTRLEREQRARRYYEQQLQERKKKLTEQRLKEERRRAAVEEKRQQRLKEEKERHESAVRRTLEKSQRAQQNLSQHGRGRKLTKNISFHSMNTTTAMTSPHKPQQHAGSVYYRSSASPSPNNRSTNMTQIKAVRKQDINRKTSNCSSAAINNSVRPATVTQSRTASPSPERTPRRSISRHSTPLQLELPSVPEEDVAVCSSALAAGNSRPVRTSAEGQQNKMNGENLPDTETGVITRTAGDGSPSLTPHHPAPQPPEVACRPSAGTTDPEEASRLLAEKRREARLQREREEQERLQKEEAERRSREELERKQAEERASQQAEAQRLIEEKKRREEEEKRRAEEERAQAMREAALLQKQREEEQAKEKAKAEQIKQEREILAQKEEVERQARKKRLEEIMRRTRRTDSPDMNPGPARLVPNDAQPKENTEPVQNGSADGDVKVPVGTKSSQLRLSNEEDMIPIVAFKERRSLRTLTGLEEIQTHQRAEVI
ncbi:MAP7 domain-containing protein 2 isoform X2 [Betta splendens]|uniref:MAP7 domain-containing protein 2 isoform X2 n=1 Tax=Betta splendens TaxID=158456 RepID=A0A9W2XJR0_BETSP|nr:MAP7 domain-containing protein 2 isoform X2 [Betta splendens]